MPDVVYEVDNDFDRKMLARREALSKIIGVETRRTIERLIGSPVRFGHNTLNRKKKANGVFRSWQRADGQKPPSATVLVDSRVTQQGNKTHLHAGLKKINEKRGGSWLESMEKGGRFHASEALVEYYANEHAQRLLKRKGLKYEF